MLTTVELPQVGESVTEGIIGKWLKNPGDHVEKYDALVEVVTDKVTMEVPSPFAGVISKFLVKEGDTVNMGSPIAEMEIDNLTVPSNAIEYPQSGSFEFVENIRSVGPTGSGEGGEGRPDADTESTEGSKLSTSTEVNQRITENFSDASFSQRLSPLVRRLAKEKGVDLALLSGSGIGGRITKEDVLRSIETDSLKSNVGESSLEEKQSVQAMEHEFEEPVTPLRKIIAENMIQSSNEIPSAWTMVEVDVTELVDLREKNKETFSKSHAGVRLTYLPFVIKVLADALRMHPRLNARWGNDRIYVKKQLNIGIAVATEDGLVVPVIREIDVKTISEIAEQINDLTRRAKEGKLKLEDVQNGTFTLNNTGALGSIISYPIINYPQAAILTTEAIVKRPIVDSENAIVVRSIMNMALAFDHRICDGSEAGNFLAAVKRGLETINSSTVVE